MFATRLVIAIAAWVLAASARAQVAVSATAMSNDVYRGITLSDGKPALRLAIAYDDANGAYAGGALTGARSAKAGLYVASHVEYIGYARRLSNGTIWDVGIINTRVKNYYNSHAYNYDLFETYTGIRIKNLNAYLYYSPNYYDAGVKTLYAQVSGSIHPSHSIRVFGHVGALTSLGGGGFGVFREQYDVELGGGSDLKFAQVQVAWTRRGPDIVYLADHAQNRDAITLSVTRAF